MNKKQSGFITVNTHLPRYLPYPEFLFEMELSQTAKLVYALLLDRMTLSQKNRWTNENGSVFVIYPVEHLAEKMKTSDMTVKRALNELREADLITCERCGYSAPYRVYVKLPPLVTELFPHTEQNCYLRGNKTVPLTTKSNKSYISNVVAGKKMISFPIPDYDCEEGASL